MPTGVFCPKDGGEIAERRSKKRGKAFYGCSNYPTCDFVAWDKPVAETCPECGYVGAEMKFNKTRGDFRKCLKCGNEWDVPAAPEPVDMWSRRWRGDEGLSPSVSCELAASSS